MLLTCLVALSAPGPGFQRITKTENPSRDRFFNQRYLRQR